MRCERIYSCALEYVVLLERTAAASDPGNGDVALGTVRGCGCERQKSSMGFISLPGRSTIPVRRDAVFGLNREVRTQCSLFKFVVCMETRKMG